MLEDVAAPHFGRVLLERLPVSPDDGGVPRAQVSGPAPHPVECVARDAGLLGGDKLGKCRLERANRRQGVALGAAKALGRQHKQPEETRHQFGWDRIQEVEEGAQRTRQQPALRLGLIPARAAQRVVELDQAEEVALLVDTDDDDGPIGAQRLEIEDRLRTARVGRHEPTTVSRFRAQGVEPREEIDRVKALARHVGLAAAGKRQVRAQPGVELGCFFVALDRNAGMPEGLTRLVGRAPEASNCPEFLHLRNARADAGKGDQVVACGVDARGEVENAAVVPPRGDEGLGVGVAGGTQGLGESQSPGPETGHIAGRCERKHRRRLAPRVGKR